MSNETKNAIIDALGGLMIFVAMPLALMMFF
jgi:hypothetical protein